MVLLWFALARVVAVRFCSSFLLPSMADNDDDDDPARSLARLLARLGVASVNEAEEKINAQEQTINAQVRVIDRRNGSAFCSLDDLYGVDWRVYCEKHFDVIRRDWNEIKIKEEDVLRVYNRTREAAEVVENGVSTSTAHTKLGNTTNKKPVRLCSDMETENCAEKARLCPKTGENREVDTWIYAAAAVLGMPSDTQEDRQSLLKALRGSVRPGQGNVMYLTGLNRSPYNLLSFLQQDLWFDKHPGVVVLPCLSPAEAREWDGGSYSIIILCNNIRSIATAASIAVNIALPRTPQNSL